MKCWCSGCQALTTNSCSHPVLLLLFPLALYESYVMISVGEFGAIPMETSFYVQNMWSGWKHGTPVSKTLLEVSL